MPVNLRYPLADVLDACRAHHAARRRTVFVEYVMLAGVNDRYEQALALAALLSPREAFKVNLIPYNPTDSPFDGLRAARRSRAFRAALESRGVRVTVRLTRGRDIDAACGQLAATQRRVSAPLRARRRAGRSRFAAAARFALRPSRDATPAADGAMAPRLPASTAARLRGHPRAPAARDGPLECEVHGDVRSSPRAPLAPRALARPRRRGLPRASGAATR